MTSRRSPPPSSTGTAVADAHGHALDDQGLWATTDKPTHMVVAHSRGWAWMRQMDPHSGLADPQAPTVRHPCLPGLVCVVGDRVELRADGYVCAVAPRVRVLRRAVGPKVKTLCANLDSVVLVTAVGRQMREGFVMRGLVSCALQDLTFRVVVNKMDQDHDGHAAEVIAQWRALGVEVLPTSAVSGEGVEAFAATLAHGMHALLGHSGVGKSTLINHIRSGANRRTGELDGQGKGRHITTMAEAVLAPGSMLVDLPGVRELGLIDATADAVMLAFPDVQAAQQNCQFSGCAHGEDEEGCGVGAAVAAGALDPRRVELCQRMQLSVAMGTEGGGRF